VGTDRTLRKVLGAHFDNLIGFLQRVDNLKLSAYRISAHLEHASQTKDVWIRSHNHLLSSRWDSLWAVARKTLDRVGGYRRTLRCG
jgi:hypothetical protein